MFFMLVAGIALIVSFTFKEKQDTPQNQLDAASNPLPETNLSEKQLLKLKLKQKKTA